MSRRAPLLVSLLLLAGCAGRPSGPTGPVISPTGIVYEPGTPPTETRWSQTAGLYIRSGEPARALEFALQGIEADAANPVHHFLAGLAYVRLERYPEAHGSFTEAQRIYPAYELDVEPEREAGWASAYNAGAEAYSEGDVAGAIEAWQGAALLFDLRPEAHRNLAMLLQDEGRFAEAIDVYQAAVEGLRKRPATRLLSEEELLEREEVRLRSEGHLAELLLVMNRFAEAEPLLRRQLDADPGNTRVQQNLALALGALGQDEEAAELHAVLLADGTLEAAELFNLGVALFRASDHAGAARAFGRLTELRPHSRDAWFNYANALFAAGEWGALTTVGDRLVELDPLNENAALITARAYLETGDEGRAIQGVRRIESAPVHVEGLALRPAPGGISLHGRMTGNRADPGSRIRLRFTFFDERSELGTEVLNAEAPPPGESTSFELPFRGQAAGYRYEVLAVEGGATAERVTP